MKNKKFIYSLLKLGSVSKGNFVYLFLLMLATTLIGLLQPMYIGRILDSFAKEGLESSYSILQEMSVLFCISLLLSFISERLTVNMAVTSENTIRAKVMKAVLEEHSRSDTGEVLTNLEDDAKVLSTILFQHMDLIVDLISLCLTIILMFIIDRTLTTILILFIPIQLLILSLFGKRFAKTEQRIKKSKEDYLHHATETILGKDTIQLFEKISHRLKEFTQLSSQFTQNKSRFFLVQSIQGIGLKFFFFSYNVIIIILGLRFIQSGKMSVGIFMTYITYSNAVISSGFGISELNSAYQTTKLSVERLLERVSTLAVASQEVTSELEKIQKLEIQNLNFSYGGHSIFTNMDLHFKTGALHVINSHSGRGKTSLFNIISGMRELDKGWFVVNGKKKQISALPKSKVSYMMQESYLFSMSVIDNIRFYNPNLSIKEIKEMCQLLDIDSSIEKLDFGYDTIVSNNDKMLSGGEIQRICLARTLLKKSDIYLLDEPLSNVDIKVKKLILDYLKELSRRTIVIMNSHDLITEEEQVCLIEI